MALGDRRVVRRVVPNRHGPGGRDEWPATIPTVATLLDDGLDPPAGVTLLVGKNGSGKSTVVEAVATVFGLSPASTPTSRRRPRRTATCASTR